jgi:nitric oxide reductase large subunit
MSADCNVNIRLQELQTEKSDMTLFLLELKKVFALRSVVITVAAFGLCFSVWLLIPVAHDRMDSFDYQLPLQMVEQYGKTIDEAEMADFTQQFRQAENTVVQIAAELGFTGYTLEQINDRGLLYEKDGVKAQKLYDSDEYERYVIMATYEQWSHNETYPHGQPYTTDIINQNMVTLYDRWFPLLITLIAVSMLLFISPFLAADNEQNIMPLQFSGTVGRKIRRRQIGAVVAAAILLTTILTGFAVGLLFLRTQPFAFWDSSVNSFFLTNRRIFEMTFGQLVLAYILQIYIHSIGAALLAVGASRFSRNMVTLMIKVVPLVVLFILFTQYTVADGILYRKLEPRSSPFLEGSGLWGFAASVAMLILTFAIDCFIAHRDRRIDAA